MSSDNQFTAENESSRDGQLGRRQFVKRGLAGGSAMLLALALAGPQTASAAAARAATAAGLAGQEPAVQSQSSGGMTYVHLGTFYKWETVSQVLAMSERAMGDYGLDILDYSRGDFLLMAQKGSLVVTTACQTQWDGTTEVVVIAAAPDSKTAELARNHVRQIIVDMGPIS